VSGGKRPSEIEIMAHVSHAGEHAGPNTRLYLIIGACLAVFTGTSFLFNYLERHGTMSVMQAFYLILGTAVIKAILVAMFFMHLKFEWGKLYFMIIPALIIATMMVIVFLPDQVLFWQKFAQPLEPPVSSAGTR
jgi:caa(3)-type oxidase subunit IV